MQLRADHRSRLFLNDLVTIARVLSGPSSGGTIQRRPRETTFRSFRLSDPTSSAGKYRPLSAGHFLPLVRIGGGKTQWKRPFLFGGMSSAEQVPDECQSLSSRVRHDRQQPMAGHRFPESGVELDLGFQEAGTFLLRRRGWADAGERAGNPAHVDAAGNSDDQFSVW